MSIVIKDGAGTGNTARVSGNRLNVQAFTRARFADVSEKNEKCYLLCTNGFISLTTTGAAQALMYIKNTSTTDHLHIENIRACGEVPQKWIIYKNATGGTLISDQTAGASNNIFLSNDNAPDLNNYIGADGKTVTGGTLIDQFINRAGHSIEDFGGAMILEKNDSISLTCEVTAAGDICLRALVYFEPSSKDE
jgi:hypothetical protein